MIPAAAARLLTPRFCIRLTAGLSAIARKADTSTHVMTCRAIHTTHRAIATPSSNPATWRTVDGRRRTTRSGFTLPVSPGGGDMTHAARYNVGVTEHPGPGRERQAEIYGAG